MLPDLPGSTGLSAWDAGRGHETSSLSLFTRFTAYFQKTLRPRISEEENSRPFALTTNTGSTVIRDSKISRAAVRLRGLRSSFLHSVDDTLRGQQDHPHQHIRESCASRPKRCCWWTTTLRNTFALSKLLKHHDMHVVHCFRTMADGSGKAPGYKSIDDHHGHNIFGLVIGWLRGDAARLPLCRVRFRVDVPSRTLPRALWPDERRNAWRPGGQRLPAQASGILNGFSPFTECLCFPPGRGSMIPDHG